MLDDSSLESHGSFNSTESTLEQEPKLGEAVRRIIVAYQSERICLFGSAARGNGGPDSDHDRLVVVPDAAPPAQFR